ncbi:MAG: NAD(P)H-binding protein, partial [Gammaproteobacteria bacterium]
MNLEPVTVFGGTGFLGRRIVRQLAGSGLQVRVAVRNPGLMSSSNTEFPGGQVTEVYADVRDAHSVAASIEGSKAVINAVSL